MSSSNVFRPRPVLVHIDMKGGPPTPRYLVELLPLLKRWGATGILIEWEDMFPWQGRIKVVAREGHYTRADIALVLQVADALDLEVVPLVQTFGHLEFLLKHAEFVHLREVAAFPNSLRPVDPDKEQDQSEGLNLVLEMVRQIIEIHQPKRIHIGCDEVWCLGQSPITSAYLETRRLNVTDVFLAHLISVARFASSLPPQPAVLAWDDMMRGAEARQLKPLDGLVEPVVWSYGAALHFPVGMLEKFSNVFGSHRVWKGSAWRGATGSCQQATTISHHVDNHRAWHMVDHAAEAGIILTGWARYDHYATLCELLPVSLPSLRCCLAVVTTGGGDWSDELHRRCSTELGLKDPIQLEPYLHLTSDNPEEPVFPGSKVYTLVLAYLRLSAQYNALYNSSTRSTWMNPWQIKTGFLNPLQVQMTISELQKTAISFRSISDSLSRVIPDLLHSFTLDEWIGTNIDPKLEELERFIESITEKLNLG